MPAIPCFPPSIVVLATVTLFLGACGALERHDDGGERVLQAFRAHLLDRAREAVDRGDLADALDAYLVLEALPADDPEITRRIGVLRHRIRQRSALHQAASQRARKAGDPRRARIELLKALALEPDNRRILGALARLEAERASVALRQRHPSRLDPAYRGPTQIERTLAPPRPVAPQRSHRPRVNPRLVELLRRKPGDAASRRRLIGELIELGDQLIAKGETSDALRCLARAERLANGDAAMRASIVALKKVYASKLYRRATALRGRDPGSAIRLLRQALRLQPDFAKARLQLRRLGGASGGAK